MTPPLRIVVADDELDMRDYFRKILPRLGHTVVAAAETGEELIAQCRTHRPDLVITDIKMPGIDGIDAAKQIYEEMPIPVILVSAYSDAKLIERAESDHIMGYLVKPIKQTDLEPAIGLAVRRFEQLQALRREASDMRQALEDRKIIERAKGVLMKELALSEAEAFRRLQKTASAKNLKLIEVAHLALTTAKAMQTP
ncbi:MAG TPA: response regulator [Gemmataceae bacterium]|nr:response regulator [Gemmataceae bacterium]